MAERRRLRRRARDAERIDEPARAGGELVKRRLPEEVHACVQINRRRNHWQSKNAPRGDGGGRDESVNSSDVGPQRRKRCSSFLNLSTLMRNTLLYNKATGGDEFYVLESGTVEFHVENRGKVGACGMGRGFGELALMYNTPRSASASPRRSARPGPLIDRRFGLFWPSMPKKELLA